MRSLRSEVSTVPKVSGPATDGRRVEGEPSPVPELPGADILPSRQVAPSVQGGAMQGGAMQGGAVQGRAVQGEVRREVQGLARAGSFSFVGLVANAALTFLFMLLVSRTLDQLAAGAVFEAVAVFTTASMIATAGANVGLMRSLPQYRRRSARDVRRSVLVAVLPTLLIGASAAAALYLAAPSVSQALVHRAAMRPETTAQIRVLAPTIPAAAILYVLLWGDRAWGMTASVGIQYIVVPFVRIAVFLGLLAVGMTAFRATVAWGIPFLVGLLMTVAVLSVHLADRRATLPGVEPEPRPLSFLRHASTFWRFAAPRSIEGILLVFLTGFDIVLVGVIGNPRLAAVYTIASRYIMLCGFGLQAIVVAIPTRISDLMHTGRALQARELYRVATWWTIGMSWPPAFALAIYAPTFMGIFGPGYRAGSTTLVVLTVGIVATSATGPGGAVLLMSGKSSANLLSTAVAVGVNVPLNFLLIPVLGATGAAVAWSVSMLITNLVQMLFLRRMFRFHAFGREFTLIASTCAGIFLGVGVVTRLVLGGSVLSLLVYAAVSLLLYGAVLHRFRGLLRVDSFASIVRGSVAGERSAPEQQSGSVAGS